MSSLYFRGKLTYARAFAQSPADVPGAFVITPCWGLMPPETIVTLSHMQEMAAARIDLAEPRYLEPLMRDAAALLAQVSSDAEVVLLGSIATPKYVEPLLNVFGERLLFPGTFVGRGDMSRGGLLLRCSRAGEQLEYIPVGPAMRTGSRPAKLEPFRKSTRGASRKLVKKHGSGRSH